MIPAVVQIDRAIAMLSPNDWRSVLSGGAGAECTLEFHIAAHACWAGSFGSRPISGWSSKCLARFVTRPSEVKRYWPDG